MIPLLRVFPDKDGRIVPYHPGRDSTDDWWGAVLGDPRAKTKFDNDWEDKIGRHRGEMLHAKCECGFSMGTDIDAQIAEWGMNAPCLSIAAGLRDDYWRCKRRDCRLTYETTKPFKKLGR